MRRILILRHPFVTAVPLDPITDRLSDIDIGGQITSADISDIKPSKGLGIGRLVVLAVFSIPVSPLISCSSKYNNKYPLVVFEANIELK